MTLVSTLGELLYVALALAGGVDRARRGRAWRILDRCSLWCARFFIAGFVETPEPRYVLECFPAVIWLWARAGLRHSPAPWAMLALCFRRGSG